MKKFETQYANLPGIQLAYTRTGSGPVLILLHGNSLSKRIFRKYQTEYFTGFDTIALDSRGHGESKSEDETYSIKQYSRDVIAFCKLKGITEANLVGYSDGGNIALHLAKDAPSIFRRIIAISPNYEASGTFKSTLIIMKTMVRFFSFFDRLGFKTKKIIMRIQLMLNDIGLTDEDLTTIQTRVGILYAQMDMIKKDHFLKMADLIPSCELQMIPLSTHMNILNKPATVQAIHNFFKA